MAQEETTTEYIEDELLWSSTGGGWRAMFADIGFVNVFQQAGIMTKDSTMFTQVSTVSGGSWFSTQLFYSKPFYDQTVMATSPEQLHEFVVNWMTTYSNISSDVTPETAETCNTDDMKTADWYTPERENAVETWEDICELLVKYDFDWALFIQAMMDAASTDYGDVGFVDRIANPQGRIQPMSTSNLLIQAALLPMSRRRDGPYGSDTTTTAVYLGTEENENKLFTVPLSAAFVVTDTTAGFVYGTDDLTSQLQTYIGPTPVEHAWPTWEPFYYFPADNYGDGTIEIDNNAETLVINEPGQPNGIMREPYGGPTSTTVLQIAAISSAAGGNGSPLAATVYSQTFSIGYVRIEEYVVKVVWRVLAGIAAGIGATILVGIAVAYFGFQWDCCREQSTANHFGIGIGIAAGAGVGLLTGFLYGVGSIIIPTVYDGGVNRVYKNSSFDNFAVCSQWPNPCMDTDAYFIDGWFIDNPALVINVGHYQQKSPEGVQTDKTLKVIITNCNESWNTTFNYAQILQYFDTYFNVDVAPGDYLWAPGYWAPFRSPQIFAEYHDQKSLDALLEPIPDSNMTTAILRGTTVDNPSFGTKAGQPVEMLLLNLNENITTFVVGKQVIDNLTVPLADMTANIAGSQELVKRVRDFVGGITTPMIPDASQPAVNQTDMEESQTESMNATQQEEEESQSSNATQP